MQANNKGYQRKKKQYILPKERAFDPKEDCEVCKGRLYGRELHRAHHPVCWNNKRFKGTTNSKTLPSALTASTGPAATLNTPSLTSQQQQQQQLIIYAPRLVMFTPWFPCACMPIAAPQPAFCCSRYQKWYHTPGRRGWPPHDFQCHQTK